MVLAAGRRVPSPLDTAPALRHGDETTALIWRAAMAVATPGRRSDRTTLTDRLSADHEAHDVTIEVVDPEGGDNPLAEGLPFDAITYDPKDDVVVSVGGRTPRCPEDHRRHRDDDVRGRCRPGSSGTTPPPPLELPPSSGTYL
jgi:Family of unknown function (DUF5335)